MGFQYEPEREDNDITDPNFDDSDNAEGDKKDEINKHKCNNGPPALLGKTPK